MDRFLFLDAVAVALLLCADFLLGAQKRKIIKEKIGEWWVRVDDMSFAGLIAEDARVVRRALLAMFGSKWWGLRCMILSLVISAALTFGGTGLAVDRAVTRLEAFPGELQAHRNPLLVLIGTIFLVPNGFFGWLSLGMTMQFLRWMERSVASMRLLLLVVADLVIVVACAMASLIAGLILAFVVDIAGNRAIGQPFTAAVVGLISFVAILSRPLFRIALIASAWPALVHLLIAAAFWASKLFRPVIQRPVGLVLLRFHESKKGTLSLLAAGLGVVAKLVQLGVKALLAG